MVHGCIVHCFIASGFFLERQASPADSSVCFHTHSTVRFFWPIPQDSEHCNEIDIQIIICELCLEGVYKKSAICVDFPKRVSHMPFRIKPNRLFIEIYKFKLDQTAPAPGFSKKKTIFVLIWVS